VGILRGRIQCEATFGAIVDRDRRARLDRVRHEPIVDKIEIDDPRGSCERTLDRRFVAQRPMVNGVLRRLSVNLRGVARLSRGGVDNGGKLFVLDLDQPSMDLSSSRQILS